MTYERKLQSPKLLFYNDYVDIISTRVNDTEYDDVLLYYQ